MEPSRLAEKRHIKDEDTSEPPPKKCKSKYKRTGKNKCHLCALPDDILQMIISFIPYWHLPRLRKSCKRLMHACDAVLLHDFEASIHHFRNENPQGTEYAILMAVKAATEPYVSNGYASTFCGTILPMIWNRNDRFVPESGKVKNFLKHFYNLVDELCGKPNSQRSRLLYCITLMGLLKKFKNSLLLGSTFRLPNYWRLVLEIRGPWVGVLSTQKSAGKPHECTKLLMILCEIMIANSTHRAFKKVWECESEVFVFGNDASDKVQSLKNPSTVFTFKINASKRVGNLLKSCLEEDCVQLPARLPRGEFLVSMDLYCREAVKWGSCQVHRLEIGPHFDADFGYDSSDEEDEQVPEMELDCS